MQRDRRTPFDLSDAPPLRLALVHLGARRYRFTLSHHHILLDGWSLPLLLQNVFAAYESFVRGAAPQLPDPRPFRDYIAWLAAQDREEARRVWRERLGSFRVPAQLPKRAATREGRPAVGNDRRETMLSPEKTQRLQSFGRQRQLTLNTILQGAWALVLSRYAGTRDVLFGSTVAGRPADLAGVESMLGLFINTLPVRIDVDPSSSVAAWLEALQREQVELRAYEHMPLFELQSLSGVPRGTPLFDTLFLYENYPVAQGVAPANAPLRITGTRAFEQTNFPLTFVATVTDGLMLRIDFDPAVYEAHVIEGMLARVEQFAGLFVDAPDELLGRLDPWIPGERERVAAWNATAVPFDAGATVADLVAAQAARTPEAVAVVCDGARLTYAELDARANRVARELQSRGARPEQLVGLSMTRTLDLIVGVLGILKSGAGYVPLDPSYPADRVAYMAADAGIGILVTEESLPGHAGVEGASVLCLDRDRALLERHEDTAPSSGATGANVAYVMYTSGSTGRPKGVVIEQHSVVSLVRWGGRELGPDTQVHILDERLVPVPLGVSGEIYIAGEGVARGYHARPELTAELFVPDPFSGPGRRMYRTGDLGRQRADATIEHLGRIDHQVKVRGYRIELGEIESVLMQHPAVHMAAAAARQRDGMTRLLVFVVPSGDAPDAAELREFLRARLSESMIPAVFTFVDALPLTANGKVDRKALPDAGTYAPREYVAPRTALERELAAVFGEVLGLTEAGIRDAFFDLGGDSISAMRVVARLRANGREVALVDLLRWQTVEALAAAIEAALPPLTLVPIRTDGSRPPLFCVHAVDGGVAAYVELARHLGNDQPVYGMQAVRIDGETDVLQSIPAMAERYVEAMRTVQPSGPYHLAGWPLGGEIAQQLRRSGEEVALVAAIDAEVHTAPRAFHESEVVDWIASQFGDAVSREELLSRAPGARAAYLHERLVARGLMPEGVTVADVERSFAMNVRFVAASRAYAAQPHDGRVLLVKAADQTGREAPEDLGWPAVARDLDIRVVGGNHFTLMSPPHVQAVAGVLSAALGQWRLEMVEA